MRVLEAGSGSGAMSLYLSKAGMYHSKSTTTNVVLPLEGRVSELVEDPPPSPKKGWLCNRLGKVAPVVAARYILHGNNN
jgi:hypothetical protein